MRVCTLSARVQRKHIAIEFSRLLFQMLQQAPADPARPMRLVGDQIIDIQAAPFIRVFDHAPQGNAAYFSFLCRHTHAGAVGDNRPQATGVISRQAGAQLAVHTLGAFEPSRFQYPAVAPGHIDNQ